MVKCEICGRGPAQGITVYRANETGIKGRWRCDLHMNQKAFENAIDPEISAIEDAIKGRKENIQ